MLRSSRLQRYLRFGLGGVANTGLSYAVFLAANTVLSYQAAYLIAYVVGILFSYVYNARAVFRVRLSGFGLLAWPLVYVVQYGIGALGLAALVEKAGIPETVAPLLIAVLMVPVTYAASRLVLQATDLARNRNAG